MFYNHILYYYLVYDYCFIKSPFNIITNENINDIAIIFNLLLLVIDIIYYLDPKKYYNYDV